MGKNNNKWTSCSSAHNWGTLYMETLIDRPEEIFVNVRSQAGFEHVREISTFAKTVDKYYDPVTERFITEVIDPLKHGWRMPLNSYLDIIGSDYNGRHIVSKVDIRKRCRGGKGITSRCLNQYLQTGSLQVETVGPALLGNGKIIVHDIEEIIKPGKTDRGKAGAKGRWKNKEA